MYSYAFNRIIRSWSLFLAFFLGLTLASTLFTGTLIGADSIGYQVLQNALTQVPVDFQASWTTRNLTGSTVEAAVASVETVSSISKVEPMYRTSILLYLPKENTTAPLLITGLPSDSILYRDAEFTGSFGPLETNQTYVEAGSFHASEFAAGDLASLRIRVQSPIPPLSPHFMEYNLTVSGSVRLADASFSIAGAESVQSAATILRQLILGGQVRRPRYDLLLISEETFIKILSSIYSQSQLPTNNIVVFLLIYSERNVIVNPWDIETSLANADKVNAQIGNVLGQTSFKSASLLTTMLNAIQLLIMGLTFAFIIIALPVFFTAWYMGMTVSDVSLNLRRREAGLLIIRGFSKRQVLGLFLNETVILALAAGALGIFLSLLILPLAGLTPYPLYGIAFINETTLVFTLVFSAAIALLAVFNPARRTANTRVVEAIREYSPTEAVSRPRRLLPTIAFILGTYKLIAYLVGLNIQTYLVGGKGLFAVIIFGIIRFVDQILGYLAPVLFFWGFSKLFIQYSTGLQTALGRFLDLLARDMGALATKSAHLNLRRTAATVFLASLIIGYGISVIGGLASADDFIDRSIRNDVGADVSVWMFSDENATIVWRSMSSIQGVSSATIERWFNGITSFGAIQLRVVNTTEWRSIAYYEESWFTGRSVNEALDQMAADNKTIILDRILATTYDLGVGQNITVTLGSITYPLRILAFFGPAPQPTPLGQRPPSFWSYIPAGLLGPSPPILPSQTGILVKLNPGVDGSVIAGQIVGLNPNIERVSSVAAQKKLLESNVLLNSSRKVQSLGVPFALMTASIGMGLIAVTTLKEKRKEVILIVVKGFSYRQVLEVQLLENLGILVLSTLLGLGVGYVTNLGNILSQNTLPALVMRRVVFPPTSITIISAMIVLIVASMTVPVMLLVRGYSKRLDWRIRG